MQNFAAIINQSLTKALKVVEDSCACMLKLLQHYMFELWRSNLSSENQVGGKSPTETPDQVLACTDPNFWTLGALLPVGRVGPWSK